jgi:hypothetical protein
MFGKAKVEDIEAWRRAKQWDKIIKALSSQDSTVRTAAAVALKLIDPSGYYGSKATIDAAFSSLLGRLADDVPDVVAAAARSLPHFDRPETPLALIAALDRNPYGQSNVSDFIKLSALRSTLIDQINQCLAVNDSSKYMQFFVAILHRLSAGPSLNPQTADVVLDLLADQYMSNFWFEDASHPEDSPIGNALVAFGPTAGAQLVKTAGRNKGPRAAAAAAFGASIVNGSACGGNHVLNAECVCEKCGVTKHSFDRKCVCTRCGLKLHDFRAKGGYQDICIRCGAMRNVQSGNISEPY